MSEPTVRGVWPGVGEAEGRLGGNCPVQGSGTVIRADGTVRHWYFRARGDAWTLDVGVGEACEVGDWYVDDATAEWSAWGAWGDGYAAGWMSERVAIAIVCEALRRYASGEASWEAPDDLFRREEVRT